MSVGCKASERPALVLVNGLAEQEQTWFANLRCWQEYFLVHQPVLTGASDGGVASVSLNMFSIDQRVERLHDYITRNVGQRVHMAANSMGGKVAIEFAVRHPGMVGRLVLLAPSGLTRRERLPIVAGRRLVDSDALVRSVFHDPRLAPEHLFKHYRLRLGDRAWRLNLLKIVRATAGHRVRELVGLVRQPTLVILGAKDRIVDPVESARVARGLPGGQIKLLGRCGHAPQIERADQVNRLVVRFLCCAALTPTPLPRRRARGTHAGVQTALRKDRHKPVWANRPIVSLN
jgi:pimeloyl-ACP methyl ester carboxylesterase